MAACLPKLTCGIIIGSRTFLDGILVYDPVMDYGFDWPAIAREKNSIGHLLILGK